MRRAARAALVIPLALAFGEFVLRDSQALIFIVFGCFAMLVMSDFGGLRPARAAVYLAATLAGAVLVTLGTLASANAWLAAGVMFAVALVLSFARVFGGYIAAGQTGLLLAFVIALSIPGPASTVPSRLTGWVFAGIISTLAATLLWPRFEHVLYRKSAARACLAIADAVAALRPASQSSELAQLIVAARVAQQAAQQRFATSPKRPAGPARRDRAFVELLTELDRLVEILEQPFERRRGARPPSLPESDQLLNAMVAALRSSADVLTGGSPPKLREVDEARTRHRTALDRWAAQQLKAGHPVDEVLDGIDADHTLRVLAYLTLALGSNAMITAGEEPRGIPLPTSAPQRRGLSGVARRTARVVRTHLTPTSTLMQSSLRVALGLALAVWLARSLGLSHAFWVVLGTLQVLRTSALGTGMTTVQAVVGNAIGVVIGGLFAFAAGNHPAVMWAALPVAIFVAAYAASAIGFMAGQAAFTINLIIVFNLLSPAGWQIGLVRLEDLGVGVAISIGVGLLLWPRGARREFARSAAGFYRLLAAYLGYAFDRILDLEARDASRTDIRNTLAARDRAGEAFDELLNEHAASPLDPQTAAYLLSAGNHALLAGELLETVAVAMGYRATSCPEGAREVGSQVATVLSGYRQLADQLGLAPAGDGLQHASLDKIRAAELDCLRRWRNDEQAGRGAMAVVIAGEWVTNLSRLEDGLRRPVTVAIEAARTPWWR